MTVRANNLLIDQHTGIDENILATFCTIFFPCLLQFWPQSAGPQTRREHRIPVVLLRPTVPVSSIRPDVSRIRARDSLRQDRLLLLTLEVLIVSITRRQRLRWYPARRLVFR